MVSRKSSSLGAEVEGLPQMRRALDQAADELDDLRGPHHDAAEIAAAAARRDAPRLTGALSASIRTEATATQAMVTVGVPYAGVITYGWPERNITAQPSIIAAVHDTEPSWLAVYRDALDRVVAKIRSNP